MNGLFLNIEQIFYYKTCFYYIMKPFNLDSEAMDLLLS